MLEGVSMKGVLSNPKFVTKFRDSQNRLRLGSLLIEEGYRPSAIYTLRETDFEYKDKKYLSLKKAYIECSDPTEYNFAIKYFESWEHWAKFSTLKNVAEKLQNWREELEIKLRADAMRSVIESAKGGNFNASKWLADGNWKVDPNSDIAKRRKDRIKEVRNEEVRADVLKLIKFKEKTA